jgi:hypothetical protein
MKAEKTIMANNRTICENANSVSFAHKHECITDAQQASTDVIIMKTYWGNPHVCLHT